MRRNGVDEESLVWNSVQVVGKNVANSLTKSVSTENFTWCRVTMGIVAMDC
jgi:hypothetical protein